jgi:hypothetical protein
MACDGVRPVVAGDGGQARLKWKYYVWGSCFIKAGDRDRTTVAKKLCVKRCCMRRNSARRQYELREALVQYGREMRARAEAGVAQPSSRENVSNSQERTKIFSQTVI